MNQEDGINIWGLSQGISLLNKWTKEADEERVSLLKDSERNENVAKEKKNKGDNDRKWMQIPREIRPALAKYRSLATSLRVIIILLDNSKY